MLDNRPAGRWDGREEERATAGTADFALGVDVGASKIEAALADSAGRELEHHRIPTEIGEGVRRVINDILRCARVCAGSRLRDISVVGVGFAGMVDGDGRVRFSPNLRWNEVPLRAVLQRRLRMPVAVTNDVRAATYYEWKFGAGRGHDHLVCLYLGTGVGGGIITGGALLEGASRTGGELGHSTLVAGGRPCHCRNSGCLEAYVGGWALRERAQEAARNEPEAAAAVVRWAGGIDQITGTTMTECARAGDRFARRFLDETAAFLGAGLVGVINTFNPDLLILGGGVVEGTPELVSLAEKWVRDHALPPAGDRVEVAHATFGGRAVALGAAAWARATIPTPRPSRRGRRPYPRNSPEG